MKTKRPGTSKKKPPPPKAPPARPRPKAARPRRKPASARAVDGAPTTTSSPIEAAPATPPDEAPASQAPAVVAQIRELEAQLDRLIDEASRRDLPSLTEPDELEAPLDPASESPTMLPPPPRAADLPSYTPERQSGPSLGGGETTVFDAARELLSSDFYLRKWGHLAMRGRSEEVDDFGFDPIYDQKARALLEFLYTRYFRVETTGIARVPTRGRCLLVANHSGTLPLDGVMLKMAVKLEHAAPRDVRWLTEDFIYHMPFLGSIMNRLGAVRACQENAERLLGKEQLCAVFPEGVKGTGKLFGERYRLQRFGRGGFIKLCLRTNTPIVPVAIVGAEETNPLLFKIESLSKALGLPYVPITPTFPALGPLGLLPAPTKWQIHFGEALDFGGHGRDAADDDLLVGKLAERVRATIQGMLDRAVGARKSVFFG